jgi:hypothetical protein
MEEIELDHDFYAPVRLLVKGHHGLEAELVGQVLDEAGMFMAHLPAHRAMSIFMQWMRKTAESTTTA